MNNYYLIYKPYLVLSQFSAVDGKKSLSDFWELPRDVYPVGRLDYDSEGLLLLTNDKSLNHRLLDPLFQHEREYWVQVDGAVSKEAVTQMANGLTIQVDGKPYRTKPCKANIFQEPPVVPERNPTIRFRKEIPAPWIQLILTEGKNRQVRKMTAKVGFPTLRLIRYRIQGLTMNGMQPGDIVPLTQQEIQKKLFYGKQS